MSASNPFFGQSVVSVDNTARAIIASFPNWGIMDEDGFQAVLIARLNQRGVKVGLEGVQRLKENGTVDPTFWVIRV